LSQKYKSLDQILPLSEILKQKSCILKLLKVTDG
jgi:hypothetical protein